MYSGGVRLWSLSPRLIFLSFPGRLELRGFQVRQETIDIVY